MQIKNTLKVVGCLSACLIAFNAQATEVTPKTNKASLLAEIKSNLVLVQGGEFAMGETIIEKPAFVKAHQVTVSSFYMSKYKISNAEFQLYLQDQNVVLNYHLSPYRKKQFKAANSIPSLPAHMYWQDAYNYCAWLSEETGLPFALPTEAQWEYVAKVGESIMTRDFLEHKYDYAKELNTGLSTYQALPRDFYPANQFGVSDLYGNGFEWMQDWFSPYYELDSALNPKGPEEPFHIADEEKRYRGTWELKTVRGGWNNLFENAVSRKGFMLEHPAELLNLTARCVVNQEVVNND